MLLSLNLIPLLGPYFGVFLLLLPGVLRYLMIELLHTYSSSLSCSNLRPFPLDNPSSAPCEMLDAKRLRDLPLSIVSFTPCSILLVRLFADRAVLVFAHFCFLVISCSVDDDATHFYLVHSEKGGI